MLYTKGNVIKLLDIHRVKRVLGEDAVEEAVDQSWRDEGFDIPFKSRHDKEVQR